MDEFWQAALGRLEAMERTQAWLARRLGVSRQCVHRMVHGKDSTPKQTRRAVAVLLDIRTERAA